MSMDRLYELVEELYPGDKNKIVKALDNSFDGQVYSQRDEKDWYKKLTIYVTYPDVFIDEDGEADLNTLRSKLGYIKQLGCNMIHVLPFMSSPMIDSGFDVSDYFLVRDELGGNLAFENLFEKANRQGIKVLADMVLNHVSYQHRWFQQAISGDSFYRDFFISRQKPPKLLKRFTDDKGVWARYDLDGREVEWRIIFPEQCGEIPHWTQAEDGWWYYHTFYPHQLDVNWDNYHIFVAYAKTLVYWAKKGVHFRLDAVPFVGKDWQSGQVETTNKTHQIVQALNLVTNQVNSSCVFLVEANQELEVTKQYFGDKQPEAEMAYNFEMMVAIWQTLAEEKAKPVYETIRKTGDIAIRNSWVNFLRNHDELSLEFAKPQVRGGIIRAFGVGGRDFREGFGLAGRTLSLLGGDERRLQSAYLILASLPGNPAIIYGDEIGKENEIEFMKEQTLYKRERTGDMEMADDWRDINRGVMEPEEIERSKGRRIYRGMTEIFQTRQRFVEFFTNLPEEVDGMNDEVLALKYDSQGEELVILINLTEDEKRIPFKWGRLVFEVNEARIENKEVVLPAYGGVWVVGWKE